MRQETQEKRKDSKQDMLCGRLKRDHSGVPLTSEKGTRHVH